MTSIETFNTSNSNDGMVDISKKDQPTAPLPLPGNADTSINQGYDEQRENLMENNNIDKEQMMDLSTPLNEVMDVQAQPMQAQLQLPSQQPMQVGFDANVVPPANPVQPQAQPAKKNIGNLTDEQVDALLAGVVALVAFSPQLKGQLGKLIPSLFNDEGSRTMAGLAVTALVAATLFLSAKKFVL